MLETFWRRRFNRFPNWFNPESDSYKHKYPDWHFALTYALFQRFFDKPNVNSLNELQIAEINNTLTLAGIIQPPKSDCYPVTHPSNLTTFHACVNFEHYLFNLYQSLRAHLENLQPLQHPFRVVFTSSARDKIVFLGKTNGEDSFINLLPVHYHGINLPPGVIWELKFAYGQDHLQSPHDPDILAADVIYPHQISHATPLRCSVWTLKNPRDFRRMWKYGPQLTSTPLMSEFPYLISQFF